MAISWTSYGCMDSRIQMVGREVSKQNKAREGCYVMTRRCADYEWRDEASGSLV